MGTSADHTVALHGFMPPPLERRVLMEGCCARCSKLNPFWGARGSRLRGFVPHPLPQPPQKHGGPSTVCNSVGSPPTNRFPGHIHPPAYRYPPEILIDPQQPSATLHKLSGLQQLISGTPWNNRICSKARELCWAVQGVDPRPPLCRSQRTHRLGRVWSRFDAGQRIFSRPEGC